MTMPAQTTGSILVADDEPDIRAEIVEYLQRFGYAVTAVANGEEALAALEVSIYDVMIIDAKMPRLDGQAVIQRLNEDEKSLPTIVLTGHLAPETIERLKRQGVSAVLEKPASLREIREQIKNLLAAV
ncbi:MAG: response regulator [Proteobacteria bacterium]|nr:response regulator [Pseudomonadota bacterium]